MSEDHRTLDDAIAMAQRALQKNMDLRDRVDELEDKVERLSAAVPERSTYHELDKDTKIGMVREHVVRMAQQQHGRAAIDYTDVMWGVFDGEPSPGHCYDLLEAAASARGYTYDVRTGENNRLRVNLDDTKREVSFSRANKDTSEGTER